jgi:putative heme iron utilization protein
VRLASAEELMTIDAHARPTGDALEPLYDVTVATPTHAERARTLAAAIATGTLCTIALEPPGYPYGSFVTVAFDGGDPVFLISALAEHTHNLERDPRASLLVAEGGADDPLANGRVTMLGECRRIGTDDSADLQHAREAFLAVHPNARYYADFRDFAFWKLRVAAVRYIGGYGRMSWVPTAEWHAAEPDPLGPSATGIIEHMNADHADALVLYCTAFSKARDISSATMTGIDRYGFEISARTAEGPRPVRLAFPRPVGTVEEARAALIALLNDARDRRR